MIWNSALQRFLRRKGIGRPDFGVGMPLSPLSLSFGKEDQVECTIGLFTRMMGLSQVGISTALRRKKLLK